MTTTLDHTHITTNGVRLHVVQAGPADGELVILLHGFPEFWYSWRKQIPALASAGYRVLAPDQRGYNLSDKPAGLAAYDLNQLAADVVGLIDAAGREQCYLVGHDWGAAVAWWVAMHYPQRLKKLAILNVPHPSIMLKTLASNPAQMLKSWYIGMFQIPWLPEQLMLANNAALADVIFKRTANAGSFSDTDIAEYRKAWQQPGATTAMLNWYRALVQRRPERTTRSRITVPTQILWGVNDVALTREMASGSLKYCDNAQLTWFEDATHWLQHDKPDAVNARLIEFLTS
ncbi:MAG: alpha/beta hydrolase [Chloroflexota bacterium]|nr:alpha/beta hydrolase [Chloroflexota bacterium]